MTFRTLLTPRRVTVGAVALAAALAVQLVTAPAAASPVGLIPPACATIDPVLYPCPAGTEQAGVRW